MTQEKLSIAAQIAQELKAKVSQVEAAIRLMDDGATVPFIARYRKEATEGLNDNQLRLLQDRLSYLRELNERRKTILESIRAQDKLSAELEQRILAADTKTRLEDLYLAYRPKRRTKALLAIEAGLEPLALALWENPVLDPQQHALQFAGAEKAVENVEAALEGASHILMERFSEDAELLNLLRQYLWQHGVIKAAGKKNKKKETQAKFADYFNYAEPIKKIPSHRALALFRGRREQVLQLSFHLTEEENRYAETAIAKHFNISDQQRAADGWLVETVRQTWKTKLSTKLELELLARLRELADEEAIRVFTRNLRDLLLAAPAGAKVTLGLDPGIRTGVKAVVVDETGKLLDYSTVFPFVPQNEWHQSIAELAKLAARHAVSLISIGNGTGSRETERLVADLMKMYPDLHLTRLVVSEAGASVYSASQLAAEEFPDLDVSLRGAVSIARRLQDPLAELVKIEPKSIGVGQYQHDVNQPRLAKSLDGVVEDCVNAVGVDVNTASVALLARISGLNEGLAKNLVQFRNSHGAFSSREQLRQVERMGEKTFQQAAGFLRIMNGSNPLDASSVHPEAYPLVEKISNDQNLCLDKLLANKNLLKTIPANQYVDEQFGLDTVRDVLAELEKPGRDPRPEFKTVRFKEGVEDIQDLQSGMILEGVVTNVTNFGAFIDIGVHQDGLLHISAMAKRFVNDPHSLVKAGDIIKVKVIEVDKERRRIGLTMKLEDEPEQTKNVTPKRQTQSVQKKPAMKKNNRPAATKPEPAKPQKPLFNTAMADAFAKLKRDTTS